MEVRNDNFYSVQGWMLNELHLQGTDLQVYAIIYGFSQDGESSFSGSVSYISQWIGASKSTVIRSLDRLTAAGLLDKDDNFLGTNYKKPRYRAIRPDQYTPKVTDNNGVKPVSKCNRCQNDTGVKMTPTSVKMTPTSVKMTPDQCQNDTHNNIYNINNNNIYIDNDRSADENEPTNPSTLSTDKDMEMIRQIWNKRFLPFDGKAEEKLIRFVERNGKDNVVMAISQASRSRYLTGQTNGKPMTINWFMNDQHLQDILDGKYDDRLKVVI